jgi:uncharacterized protein with GYD domain
MATFIQLACFTEQGIRNIRNLRTMIDETHQVMEAHGIRLAGGWITLGEYDVIELIEAPDAKTAAKVSALIAARGNFRTTTLTAIALGELSDAVEERAGPGSPTTQ